MGNGGDGKAAWNRCHRLLFGSWAALAYLLSSYSTSFMYVPYRRSGKVGLASRRMAPSLATRYSYVPDLYLSGSSGLYLTTVTPASSVRPSRSWVASRDTMNVERAKRYDAAPPALYTPI